LSLSAHRLILIVDDDDDLRETLVDALIFEGLTVASARDGQEGLAWLREHQGTPCLVVLDLMMPVMDGRTLLGLKAADPVLASIPVIVLTAGGDCHQLKASGRVEHCLAKTVPLSELVAAIAAHS
jgi:CheY-like chemotaxis protein